jgi:hypothetical protein
MGMLNWILRTRKDRDVTLLAERIADDCHDLVWQLIAPRAGLLKSMPEARGYIRARAWGVVRKSYSRLVDRRTHIPAASEQRTLEKAIVLVIGKFAGPMMRVQPAVAPLRRAA